MAQIDRIFELHQIFCARRTPITGPDLQQRLGCSRATLARDIARLRENLNAPLEFDKQRGGYLYQQNPELPMFELPGLWFSAQELAALVSFQTMLDQAAPGLLDDVLAPIQARVDRLLGDQRLGLPDWSKRIRILRMAARATGPCFNPVADALGKRRRLQLEYRARSTTVGTARKLSPQRLTWYRDNWYLDAWCHLRNGLRTFSVDRISKAKVLSDAALEITPQELDRQLAGAYGIYAGAPKHSAELEFSASAARWVAEEQWHPQQQARRLADGRLILRVPYRETQELIMDVLRHGPEVVVRKPASLRRAVAQRLNEAAARYRDG